MRRPRTEIIPSAPCHCQRGPAGAGWCSVTCIFCDAEHRVLIANALAFATRDAAPVAVVHTLIVPRRHCEDFFALTEHEVVACFQLLRDVRAELGRASPPPDGYNVGVNVGAAGGQGVPHLHFHLIPPIPGDIPTPRGRSRNTLPSHLPTHPGRL